MWAAEPSSLGAMKRHEQGQVAAEAAEVYEQLFVPALFADWAEVLVGEANVSPRDRVLDVACGTGVVARRAAEEGAQVVGLDVNANMLAVARRHPNVEWRQGRAESLPFDDGAFDVVLSQFGLMFFDDRPAALREMRRVLRTNGRMIVAVWGALEETPGYARMAALLERLFGPDVAQSLHAPYSLGDRRQVTALCEEAGIEARVETRVGTVRFPSIEEWVHTDVYGWTLAGQIDDDQYQTLLREARREMQDLVTDDGSVRFASPAILAIV